MNRTNTATRSTPCLALKNDKFLPSILPWERIFPCSCLMTLPKYCLVHITASTLRENMENCRKCNDPHLNLKISA